MPHSPLHHLHHQYPQSWLLQCSSRSTEPDRKELIRSRFPMFLIRISNHAPLTVYFRLEFEKFLPDSLLALLRVLLQFSVYFQSTFSAIQSWPRQKRRRQVLIHTDKVLLLHNQSDLSIFFSKRMRHVEA